MAAEQGIDVVAPLPGIGESRLKFESGQLTSSAGSRCVTDGRRASSWPNWRDSRQTLELARGAVRTRSTRLLQARSRFHSRITTPRSSTLNEARCGGREAKRAYIVRKTVYAPFDGVARYSHDWARHVS